MSKRTNEWQRKRNAKIKELVATGEYVQQGHYLIGACKRCRKHDVLDLHHKKGRNGSEAHESENLEPICRNCHWIEHGVIMAPDTKKKKKSAWQTDHTCIHCKAVVSTLLCNKCNKISIKEQQ